MSQNNNARANLVCVKKLDSRRKLWNSFASLSDHRPFDARTPKLDTPLRAGNRHRPTLTSELFCLLLPKPHRPVMVPEYHQLSPSLIHTPLQRGVWFCIGPGNCFNGFPEITNIGLGGGPSGKAYRLFWLCSQLLNQFILGGNPQFI